MLVAGCTGGLTGSPYPLFEIMPPPFGTGSGGVESFVGCAGYPPDLQAEATKLVLEQAEALCADWAA